MFRRRETMIALRARHQSLEVARGVAYPPLEVHPPEPLVHLPPDFDKPPPPPLAAQAGSNRVVDFLMTDTVLVILAIIFGVTTVLLCKFG
jgi:hypothetical protein